MIGHLLRLGPNRPLLAALLALCLLPALAVAESVYVRNEAPGVVVVQAASVVRGVLQRDPPYQLKPGDITPAIMLPGNKIIAIYDSRNRLLHRSVIPATTEDQHYGVVLDVPPRVRIEQRRPFKNR
jgi:hypothetical protein